MELSQISPLPKLDANGNLIRSDVEQAAERVKAITAQAIDHTADAAVSAFDETTVKRKQLRTSQQQLMSNAARCMRSYPLATIDLAFGVGFLINRLLGRSND